jgi:Terpene synthase family 2, C-terminal metal binding
MDIRSPFPYQVNEHAELARAQLTGWTLDAGLVHKESARKRFEKADFGWFVAMVYPTASASHLELVANWFAWLFLVDDQLDDGGFGRDPEWVRRSVRLMRTILENPGTVPADVPAVITSLTDLWVRTVVDASAAWRQRFTGHLVDCLETAAVWEVGNRVQGIVPDEDTYIAKRRHTGAIYVCMDLIEIVERLDVPGRVYDSPRFAAALDAACNVVVWTNDVYSLEKERSVGEVHNLVYVVEHHRGLDRSAALAQVCAAIEAETQRYLASEIELLRAYPRHADMLVPYLAGMRTWMRGNLDWSARTRRYQPTDAVSPAHYLETTVMGTRR